VHVDSEERYSAYNTHAERDKRAEIFSALLNQPGFLALMPLHMGELPPII